ncbi:MULTISPECIES: beta-ketoacyl synthase N-terminal-like domain-containing protein [Sorangium]|uniref:Beta-ketoacyl synthase n=1 Tax=Sorangium cellulosum (strain So ce56) TaxID=448385 RepID=A9GJ13_SORC5|nr:beta-ketoacyl synthase N-terminal-like domain-containing protein [Sorangium cellulosum]CAN93341.1 Putative beta-ketoacyl synthase [Sorangium cellulosum So ce56]
MRSSGEPEAAITGVGVTSAIGQTRDAFARALLRGESAFGVMQRPGRQKGTAFLGAEIASLQVPEGMAPQTLRKASFSARVALATLHEAWRDARLDDVDPRRIGLIVGGSNVQQRDLVLAHEEYAGRADFLRPTYGVSFMDTDLCGFCTEQFGIRGLAYTAGGASASGQLAIIQAIQAVQAGHVDVCIALGALMDISFWECQGLASLGAMGSERHAAAPERACRPFDRARDGFIYGECCGAVVVEALPRAARRGVRPYAWLSGWGIAMDANRNPDPSLDGEVEAIRRALRCAGCAPADIDYVNPHGTGSVVGDETELEALRACGLSHARLNATKSLVGHGLSAAGAVEVIATLLQMQEGRLHPSRNLDDPIDPSFNWVRGEAVAHTMKTALTLSMGFGGINTALCLRKYSG